MLLLSIGLGAHIIFIMQVLEAHVIVAEQVLEAHVVFVMWGA